MTDFTADYNMPTSGRTIAAAVIRIPPTVIVAAAALGAYATAPVLVEYFKLDKAVYAVEPNVRLLAQPQPKPIPPPPPVVHVEEPPVPAPAAPPPIAPVILAVPALAPPPVAMVRPAIRGHFFRAASPRFRFAGGMSGFRAMSHIPHAVQMLNIIHRFRRF